MLHPVRILVVEDEILIAMCLEMELIKAGYEVCSRVTNGEEAIVLATQDAPDLILMDIRLADDIDGIEAARTILASSQIPIIFMTGYPDKEHAERAKQLNPLGYFIKPVRIHDLQLLIDSIRR